MHRSYILIAEDDADDRFLLETAAGAGALVTATGSLAQTAAGTATDPTTRLV